MIQVAVQNERGEKTKMDNAPFLMTFHFLHLQLHKLDLRFSQVVVSKKQMLKEVHVSFFNFHMVVFRVESVNFEKFMVFT